MRRHCAFEKGNTVVGKEKTVQEWCGQRRGSTIFGGAPRERWAFGDKREEVAHFSHSFNHLIRIIFWQSTLEQEPSMHYCFAAECS